MNSAKNLLKKIIGDEGYEKLEKAIYRSATQSVVDPLEFYLPLLVVPRAILSWLVQNIQPLKVGEYKTFKFPGREDISIQIEKLAPDIYRGEFVQRGRIIHTFEKQNLPSIGGHFMTVMEQYDHLKEASGQPQDSANQLKALPAEAKFDDTKNDKNNQAAEAGTSSAHLPAKDSSLKLKLISDEDYDSKDIVRSIMYLNDVYAENVNSDAIKWMMSHANIKELTAVIGKLIDALVAKQIKINNIVDLLNNKLDENYEKAPLETKLNNQDNQKQGDTTEKQELKATPQEEKNIAKEELKIDKPAVPKEAELLQKPYVSEAQRRWAHTPAGMKALGGKKVVEHWDKESKGKKLPERATKVEMPAGAGMPKQSLKPQAPKMPVQPSQAPAAAAAKQAQLSAKGKMATYKTPGAPAAAPGSVKQGPKMPGLGGMNKPQTPNLGNINKPPVTKIELNNQKLKDTNGSSQDLYTSRSTESPKITNLQVPISTRTVSHHDNANIVNKAKDPEPLKKPINKTEQFFYVNKDEIYSLCEFCHQPEFIPDQNGNPLIKPCACFSIITKNNNKNIHFVKVHKTEDGNFKISFHKSVDADTRKAFLLTLKARILLNKKMGK